MAQGAATTKGRHKTMIMVFSMIAAGLGIGWLLGLAVSPVAATVIATVTATAAAVVSALSGIEDKSRLNINPAPVAILIVGLVIGSVLGIWFRNADVLAPDVKKESERWLDAGLKMSPEDVVARLFDSKYPSVPLANSDGNSVAGMSSSVLFVDSMKECDLLITKEGSDLRKEMASSPNPKISGLADAIPDDEILLQVTRNVLCE